MRKNIYVIIGVILMMLIFMGAANVLNYHEQGGSRWVVGGDLDIVSGGEIDIESGAYLEFAGTSITASAAEINQIDGVRILAFGDVDINDGATTGGETVSGVLPDSIIVISPNEACATLDYFYGSCSTDSITVTVDADPETTVTFHYIVIGG